MAMIQFQDETVFHGDRLMGEAYGECVVYTGSQRHKDALCMPSVFGKVVLFTYPHVGVCGAVDDKRKVMASAAIARSFSDEKAGVQCDISFAEFLQRNNVCGIEGADPRDIALHAQRQGPLTCAIADSEERCAHLNRFPPEKPLEFAQEQALRKQSDIAVVDLGMSYKAKQVLTKRLQVDIYNADVKYEEIEDYKLFAFMGGYEGFADMAEGVLLQLMAYKKPVVGLGAAHAIMAKQQGWKLSKDRTSFGSSAVKQVATGRVHHFERSDWYSVYGQGTGTPLYIDADEAQGVSGLSYYTNCMSLAFDTDFYEETEALLQTMGGELNA